jgi:hypothetical protein
MRRRVEYEYKGLLASGVVVTGDTMGDGSIPGGEVVLDRYVDELVIEGPYGDDLYEDLRDEVVDWITDRLLEEAV